MKLGNRGTVAMRRTSLRFIRIRARPGRRSQGWLFAGPTTRRVALGRAGIKADKREGDGGTPAGRFHPVRLWWRADRLPRPAHLAPGRAASGPTTPGARTRRTAAITAPFRRSANEPGDRLRRDDGLYDLIIEIDHNTRPRVAGRGSAVFIHVARDGFAPTAGCVALRRNALLALLAKLSPKTRIMIHS